MVAAFLPHVCVLAFIYILLQYREYFTEVGAKQLSACEDFDSIASWLDSLLFATMSDKKSYCKLWNVVQMLLVLSQLNVPGKT